MEGLAGQFIFCNVCYGTTVISSELVLVSSQRIYSFSGGTIDGAFSLRPNDLLTHSVIEWGIQHDKEAYVLGGGLRDSDGIVKIQPYATQQWSRPCAEIARYYE
jgi:Acetyltransferase (GNAT) domain